MSPSPLASLGIAVAETFVTYAPVLMFIVLVAPPLYARIHTLPDRIHDYRRGAWPGVLFAPLAWLVVVPTAVAAWLAAQHIPALQWALLGYNVVVAPLRLLAGAPSTSTSTAAGSAGAGAGAGAALGWATIAAVGAAVVFLAVVMLIFVWDEEGEMSRGSYPRVGVWAAWHLIMGIPVYAVAPIFAVGVLFKHVGERWGRRVAYAAHVTYNVTLIVVLAAALLAT